MRRLMIIGLVVAATTVLLPVLALADNQEVAERIAGNLRDSGQLQGYKIGVKFENGTAWLRGRVASKDQIAKVLKVVWRTDGVERVVHHLEVAGPEASMSTTSRQSRLKTPRAALTREQASRQVSWNQDRHSGDMSGTARRLQDIVDDAVTPAATNVPVGSASRSMAHAPQPFGQPTMMRSNRPVPVAYVGGQPAMMPEQVEGTPMPAYGAPMAAGAAPVRYDQPCMPNCAWPSYAAYPNYAAVTYPKQYSPTAWPFIGPFYPYPQVPLGWRKVTLEWDDGWWMLDFKDGCCD